MAAASVVWGVSVHPHGEQLESCTLFCKLFLLPASCSLAFTISTTVYSSCIGPVLTAACCFECCSLLFTKLLRLLYSTRLQRHGQAQKHAQAGSRSKSSQVTVQLYSSRTAVLRTYSCTAVQQPYSCTSYVQLYSCTAVRPYSYTEHGPCTGALCWMGSDWSSCFVFYLAPQPQ
jgi:hypothetical protein